MYISNDMKSCKIRKWKNGLPRCAGGFHYGTTDYQELYSLKRENFSAFENIEEFACTPSFCAREDGLPGAGSDAIPACGSKNIREMFAFNREIFAR
jgi:hypothetical protein